MYDYIHPWVVTTSCSCQSAKSLNFLCFQYLSCQCAYIHSQAHIYLDSGTGLGLGGPQFRPLSFESTEVSVRCATDFTVLHFESKLQDLPLCVYVSFSVSVCLEDGML